jgi:hypothetical protein
MTILVLILLILKALGLHFLVNKQNKNPHIFIFSHQLNNFTSSLVLFWIEKKETEAEFFYKFSYLLFHLSLKQILIFPSWPSQVYSNSIILLFTLVFKCFISEVKLIDYLYIL